MSDPENYNLANDKAVELDVEAPREIEARRLGLALKLEHVTVTYDGISAIEDISIDMQAGDTVGLIGNNGAGKSTLCDVICGLTKPSSGSIHVKDKDVSKLSALKRAKLGLRRVFQNPVIFDDLTIEENIIIGSPPSQGDGLIASMFMPSMVTKERTATARELMDYCSIEKVKGKNLSRLPYGTKKRIELARALMGNPRILILDEPAASMDDDEKARYAQVVSDYCETFSTTLILVEHDLDFIKSLCKRAVALDAGKLLADGQVFDVLHNKEVMATYLGEK